MKCENCPYRFEIIDNLCCGRDYFCILQPSAGTDFQAVDEMGNPDGAEDEECKLPDTIDKGELRNEIILPLKALIRRILKEVKKHEAE